MRLFLAINFNDMTKAKLLALRDDLCMRSKRGNFSLPENLHLTLVFLGECDMKQTSAIKAAMNEVSFKPFDLTVERIGRFKRGGGDVWWAGVRENKTLSSLQSDLTDKLTTAGFILDKRKYSPHITLGREVITDISPWQIEPFTETLSSVDLMKSQRLGGKLTYTAIYERRGK